MDPVQQWLLYRYPFRRPSVIKGAYTSSPTWNERGLVCTSWFSICLSWFWVTWDGKMKSKWDRGFPVVVYCVCVCVGGGGGGCYSVLTWKGTEISMQVSCNIHWSLPWGICHSLHCSFSQSISGCVVGSTSNVPEPLRWTKFWNSVLVQAAPLSDTNTSGRPCKYLPHEALAG